MPLDPLTIIAAVVAILVVWKLRSVLGQRTGVERPPTNPFVERGKDARTAPPQDRAAPQSAKVINLPGAARSTPDPARWRPYAEPDTPVAAGLNAIAAADTSFAPGSFLEGAKIAYERVIAAFASGDRKELQSLLAEDVYGSFAKALDDRAARGETMSTTFVSMDDAKIEAADLRGRTARIGIRFKSKQISATHGADGQLADGSADRTVDIDDMWTFARDVASRDPNWKLVATQSGQ